MAEVALFCLSLYAAVWRMGKGNGISLAPLSWHQATHQYATGIALAPIITQVTKSPRKTSYSAKGFGEP